MFEEIQEHYEFVCGSYQESPKYVHCVLLVVFWEFTDEPGVAAIAALAVVPKKKAPAWRKLLMQRSTDYEWQEAKMIANHGLLVDPAIGRLHVPSDMWTNSVFDESNAVSAVGVPDWKPLVLRSSCTD